MNLPRMLLALAAAALVVPTAVSTDGNDCTIRTSPSTQLGDGHYMYGAAAEFWEEANGIPGLQRVRSSCLDGPSLPADRCITHQENGALVACAFTYAGTLSP